jgi:hypothetical protein
VTEYGHQTRPQDPFGVTYAQQALYVRQSIEMARKLPFVGMFIWFIYQDNPGQPWESGLYTRSGASKGRAPAAFRATAVPLDARDGIYTVRRGTSAVPVKLFVRRFCATDPTGTPIGMTWRVYRASRLVAVGQQSSRLLRDCTVASRIRLRQPIAKGQTLTAVFDLNDENGSLLTRSLTIRGV